VETILALIFWLAVLAFFWTYFGYPLLMMLRARSAPAVQLDPISELPALTLLIPAHNEADVIQRKLDNAIALAYPASRLQILVVDDGSTDGTVELVQRYRSHGISLIQQPVRSGKMAAVNTGFALASGEIVVLSDASPSYEAHSLEVLARRFADPTIGVVVGTLAVWDAVTAVAKPAGLYWRYETALRRWESRTGSTVAVHGNMFAVRKALYKPLRVGTINDEFSIAMEVLRQGYRVVYAPDAISYDDASTSMADEFNRRARINAGRYQALFSAGYLRAPTPELTFRLFSHKLLRPLTPVLMLLILLANVALVLLAKPATGHPGVDFILLRGGWGWLVLAGQCALYGLALLGWWAERRGMRNRILNIIYFFVSSNLAALVGLWRWLRGSQRVTWQKRSAED
jgi:biofilm PGA synthesis N-glycosyltransferase PgaC